MPGTQQMYVFVALCKGLLHASLFQPSSVPLHLLMDALLVTRAAAVPPDMALARHRQGWPWQGSARDGLGKARGAPHDTSAPMSGLQGSATEPFPEA